MRKYDMSPSDAAAQAFFQILADNRSTVREIRRAYSQAKIVISQRWELHFERSHETHFLISAKLSFHFARAERLSACSLAARLTLLPSRDV